MQRSWGRISSIIRVWADGNSPRGRGWMLVNTLPARVISSSRLFLIVRPASGVLQTLAVAGCFEDVAVMCRAV